MADSRTRSAGSRNFTQVTSMYHPWKVTMKAHLQLWKQAGQELALGGLPHALRGQQELHSSNKYVPPLESHNEGTPAALEAGGPGTGTWRTPARAPRAAGTSLK